MANGFFLGGLAKAATEREAQDSKDYALGLQGIQIQDQRNAQQEQLQLAIQKATGERADKYLSTITSTADKLFEDAKNGVAVGKIDAVRRMAPMVQTLQRQAAIASQALGVQPVDYVGRFNSILETVATPGDKGAAAAATNIGQTTAEIAGGLPQLQGQAEGAKILASQPDKTAAEIANIGATARPKANAAAMTAAATMGAEIGARAVNVDAIAATEAIVARAKKVAESQVADPSKSFANANVLRDEFNALTKDFRTQQEAYGRIKGATENAAGDLALLYGYNKMLDPNSVVRESEFATVAGSGSLGERLQGAVQRLLSGERLTPDQRKAFRVEAEKALDVARKGYNTIRRDYEGIAKRANIDPKDALPDFDTRPKVNMAPGTVFEYEGRRYRVTNDGRGEEL